MGNCMDKHGTLVLVLRRLDTDRRKGYDGLYWI